MENKNRPFKESQTGRTVPEEKEAIANPFENNQPVEQDIARSKEELENEQQFKQAQRERD